MREEPREGSGERDGEGSGERDEAGFWSESGGALVIVALFVAGGLGAAALFEEPPSRFGAGGASPYSLTMADPHAEESESSRVWLVDGFNLLHAAVLTGRERSEWWRRPARERVLELAAGLPEADAEIVVVFDGDDPGEPQPEASRVRQVFAPSADEWLVREVKSTPRGRAVAVVTADRKLADRARHHGAEIVSPRSFAERCRQVL